MKNIPYLILFVVCCLLACNDDNDDNNDNGTPTPTVVSISSNQEVSLDGSLTNGIIYDDLSWAQDPNVACWVTNQYYEGRHRFYIVDIPQGQKLTVRLMPQNQVDINLYGYIDYDGTLPPLSNVINCEASPATTPSFNPPGGQEEVVVFAQAINQGFTALVGAAGADGILEGEYDITFTLEDF